jgi:hypothetical protein
MSIATIVNSKERSLTVHSLLGYDVNTLEMKAAPTHVTGHGKQPPPQHEVYYLI